LLHRTSLRATVTLVVLGLLLLFLAGRQKNWELRSRISSVFKPSPPPTPEDGVYKMLDSARAGDAQGYLDCFSGKMREQLLQVVKETSSSKFSKYLVDQNSAFTGVALTVENSPDPEIARVRVEYVYGERNEAQDLYLRKADGAWKIFKVAGSEQIKTLIPYGTAVTD
jgi:hypothetical protein